MILSVVFTVLILAVSKQIRDAMDNDCIYNIYGIVYISIKSKISLCKLQGEAQMWMTSKHCFKTRSVNLDFGSNRIMNINYSFS